MTVPHSPITPGWDAECHGSAYILPASAQRASATGPMPAQIPNRRSRVLNVIFLNEARHVNCDAS
ncbi:uncharacterized protein PHALS_05784 [Plasmopara halstedii]|uniref:Uncharacterized protein n=1 Tax=Plasmopara halstedii TaxID=4781 RepID=A0A0P1AA43_PLAHL|nr:uncharacterized protein PHALS_05784 [Plasmopara halstedii]CEG37729.1 hypothetical protein PHALS_05784 [Plasmopara halstedii]|eukprot:XP_024574098.1 hypothetical protein PHALS_05784 [Plasmopara halstedii]